MALLLTLQLFGFLLLVTAVIYEITLHLVLGRATFLFDSALRIFDIVALF